MTARFEEDDDSDRVLLAAEGTCVAESQLAKLRTRKKRWFALVTPWGIVHRQFVEARIRGRDLWVNLVTGSLFDCISGESLTCSTLWIDFEREVGASRKRKVAAV